LAVTADKAYDNEKVRQQIKDEGALPIIPSRSNVIKGAYCPKRFYRQRHKIENYFCRIKDWRRIRALRPKELQWVHASGQNRKGPVSGTLLIVDVHLS
jgi:hypothetical protein